MYRSFFKRFLDIVLSLLAILILGWLLAIIAIWLHFANKGAGAFFIQERPGKNSKIFKIFKFKSMSDEKDEYGNLLPDKDRLTPIGAFIRRTSIDELPQLFNVLLGEMSFIGPRPLLPEYLPYYSEREKLRHTVRPGITGLAQVNGRNYLSWEELLEQDAYYSENLSFDMDIRILLKTIKNVIKHEGVSVIASECGIGKLSDERRGKPGFPSE